jgi:glycerate kinase
MKIIVCPDSFKGSCSAVEVAAAIARGAKRVVPDADIVCLPLADGGEGTVQALCARDGVLYEQQVCGPLMRPVTACWGMAHGRIAIVEMAAASGLERLEPEEFNPLHTTTFGTGELVCHALEHEPSLLILGIGGSSTNDGGTGMAQALGYRFYDNLGNILPDGLSGGRLKDISRIDAGNIDPRIHETEIDAACDVTNPLCGPQGAAFTYAPQKGAGPDDVIMLDEGLAHLADVIERDLGMDIRTVPGSGAAGGLGAGALAFLGARFRSGIELVLETAGFEEHLAGADLVITGEGKIDYHTAMGKVLSGVLQKADRAGVKTIALAGFVDESNTMECDCFGIVNEGTPTEEAMARPEHYIEQLTVKVIKHLKMS